MSPETAKAVTQEIVNGLDTVATLAESLDPALTPLVLIGKAVDKALPGLAENVASWIQGGAPTEAELKDFAQQLETLSDPNLP